MLEFAATELDLVAKPALVAQPAAVSQSGPAGGSAAHYQLHLRSSRGAPEALVVFPASAHVVDIALATAAGPARTELTRLRSGATLLDIVSLPAAGVEFSVDAAGPMAVQGVYPSYYLPERG